MLDDLILEEMIKSEQAKRNAQMAAQNPQDVTMSDVAKAVKPAVLPTLGQLAGTAAGLAAGPAAPFATPVLEALGGMGGEYLNQRLGITPPSTAAIGVQGVLPIGMRGAQVAAKVLPASTAGASFLHQVAPLQAEAGLAKVAATQPLKASDYFAQAEAQSQRIPTLATRQTIKDEIKNNLTGSAGSDAYRGTVAYLNRLDAALGKNMGAMTPTQYQKELRDLGAKLSGAEGKKLNQVEFKSLATVKDALTSALDTAPEGSNLAMARHLSNREGVLNDLGDMTKKAFKTVEGAGEERRFALKGILDKINTDEKFQRRFNSAFTPEEQKQVKSIFTKLNNLPTVTTPSSAFNKTFGDISQGLKVGAVSHILGADPTTASAVGLAGMMTRPVVDTSKVLTQALGSSEGRSLLLKELSASKGRPVREILQKVAVALNATEPAGTAHRELFSTTGGITPFGNER